MEGVGDEGLESSMEAVMRDPLLVAMIVSKLNTAPDRHAAALVCRSWHDAITWQASKLILRSRSSLPYMVRPFKHVVSLDLSWVDEQLTDSDLEFCATSFNYLRSLSLGHQGLVQEKISDAGMLAFAEKCSSLEYVSLAGLSKIGDAALQSFGRSRTPFLKTLVLESCRNLTDAALEAICDFPALVDLRLKGDFRFTPAGLAKVGSECRGLVTVGLDLGASDIDPTLKALAEGCRKLQELFLKFRRAALSELVKCSSLVSLVVETDQQMPSDGPILAIAKANKNLKELVFVNTRSPLTDSSVIGVILNCPMLEKFHLEAGKLTDAAVLCIVNCKALRHLNLENLKGTSEGLAEIGLCGGLKTLALKHARGLRDMELQSLMNLNRDLECVDLQRCLGITSIGFASVASCRKLQVLDLSYTEVDDLSLLAIASGVPHLRQLTLIKCQVVTSLAAVAKFATLESLNVDQCPFVSDHSMELLAQSCSRLAHLSLAFTNISDRGLDYLCQCSLLRSLRVSYCRMVKGPGVVDIAKACGGFQHVTMSHKFRNSKTLAALKEQSCRVSLEMDDMALVPFGYNMNM